MFKFGRKYEKQEIFNTCSFSGTYGTSGTSGISNTHPQKNMMGIKKYYFYGKYPKPR